jgi:hypothetical protein
VRTVSALGKSVETHFVPAFGHIVRSEIGTGETMKHRGKHPSASCYEIITTRQTHLRPNRRNERGQAGLDRLADWSVSHTSCVTCYTRFIPSVCYKRAGEKSRPESCAISALANDGFALKPEKRIWTG